MTSAAATVHLYAQAIGTCSNGGNLVAVLNAKCQNVNFCVAVNDCAPIALVCPTTGVVLDRRSKVNTIMGGTCEANRPNCQCNVCPNMGLYYCGEEKAYASLNQMTGACEGPCLNNNFTAAFCKP